MTNKQKATALKELVDTLAQEGDQWLLREPFVWEKSPEWTAGDVAPYPHNLKVTPSESDLKAGSAIDAVVKNSAFSGMFVSVFRDGEMMVLSIPDLYDIMVPFAQGSKVWLSCGEGSSWSSDFTQPYYDIYPGTKVWVNGEILDPKDSKQLTEAGLVVLGQWPNYPFTQELVSRCEGESPIVCIRQEHYPDDSDRAWSVHGPFWADPTCIFYKA